MSIRGLRGGQISDQTFRGPQRSEESQNADLLVVIDEEALHDENMDGLAVGVRGQADAVGAGELDRVLLPALHGADHGLHVQSGDH